MTPSTYELWNLKLSYLNQLWWIIIIGICLMKTSSLYIFIFSQWLVVNILWHLFICVHVFFFVRMDMFNAFCKKIKITIHMKILTFEVLNLFLCHSSWLVFWLLKMNTFTSTNCTLIYACLVFFSNTNMTLNYN